MVQLFGFITQLLGQTGEFGQGLVAEQFALLEFPAQFLHRLKHLLGRIKLWLVFLYLPLGEILQIGSDVLDDGGISLLIQIGFATVFRHKAKRTAGDQQ